MSTEVAPAFEFDVHERLAAIPVVEFLLQQGREQANLLLQKRPEVKLPAVPESVSKLPEQARERTATLRAQAGERASLLNVLARERLSPWIAALNTFIHAKIDIAEEKYSFFFQAPPEEVIKYAQERRLELTEKAKVVFEERVKVPAIAVGKDLDLRSKFIVDYVEARVPAEVDQSGAQFQYQRALNISKVVGEKTKVRSTEQLKQIREQNALIARAAEKAEQVASVASAQAATVPGRVQELKERYGDVEKLKKLSADVSVQIKERAQSLPVPRSLDEAKGQARELPAKAQELRVNLTATLKERAENLPAPLRELPAKLPTVYSEVRELVREELPLKEKVPRVGKHVAERLSPEAELLKRLALDIFAQLRARFAPAQTA